MTHGAQRETSLQREARQALLALERFDRLGELAGDERLPADARERLLAEALGLLGDAGPVRLRTACEILGVPDSTLREWIGDGVLEVVASRPSRLDLVDVARARDVIRGADPRGRKRRLIETTGGEGSPVPASLLVDWVRRGLVRALPGPYGTFDLDADERTYLESHGELLRALDEVLGDAAADVVVLFGSAARGTDRPDSDVDLLVDMPGDDGEPRRLLAAEVKRRLGRPVDTVTLRSVDAQPWLLASILHEGRVVRDTDGRWARLRRAAPYIDAAATEAVRALAADARAALEEMKRPA